MLSLECVEPGTAPGKRACIRMGIPETVGVIEDMIIDYQDAIELCAERPTLHGLNPTSSYIFDWEDTLV